MKRVAMYTTSQLFGERTTGGLKRFLELYKGLLLQGIEVDLYTGDSKEVLIKYNIEGVSLNRKAIKNDTSLIPAEFKILLDNRRNIKRMMSCKYKHVIVFDVPTAITLCLMGVKNIQLFIRQDLIAYKRISIDKKTKKSLIKTLYLEFMRLSETICLLKSERIIIQCHYDLNALMKRHFFIKKIIYKKSIIQMNNVDPSWIIIKSKAAKEILSCAFIENCDSKFVIGFVGDFSNERKGHSILIDATKKILDQSSSIEVLLIGDGTDLSKYENECQDYEHIKFLGRVDNPMEFINKCNLAVVPSLADSCPNTIMEAIYNEVPVIGSNSGGIPEILKNSNALFETNSISLKKKIEYYLNEDNLIKLREQQKKRKQDLVFDWPRTIIEHLRLD